MSLSYVLIILLIYAGIFNHWVIPTVPIGKVSILSSLKSPQIFLFISSLILLFFTDSFKKFFQTYFKSNIFKNISYGVLYALIAPLLFSLFIFLYSLSEFSKTGQWYIPWNGQALYPYTQLDLLFLWLLAPISEEIFFRGLLFTSLKQKYSLHAAVILSALLFMSTHGSYHLGSLILGIAMAYASHVHQSLWPAIIFHSISNAYMPILCWYFPNTLDFFQKFTSIFYIK